MFSIYITLTVLQNFVVCLVPFSPINKQLSTEEIVKNTIVSLFGTLKFNEINFETRINESLNKHFSQTSKDFNNSNEYNINVIEDTINNTIKYAEFINKLIYGDNHERNNFKYNNEIIDFKYDKDLNQTLLSEYFLNRFKNVNKNYRHNNVYVNINKNVLEHLKNLSPPNTTDKINSSLKNDFRNENNEFWEPSGRRIFKGERTKIKTFPFMASVHIFNSFYCAGSILSSDIVITACSCLQLAWNNRFFRENPAFLSVRIGSSFYEGGGEVIPVLEIFFYPAYDPKSLKHNVCLLRLVRHIKFGRRVRNVKKIIFDRDPSTFAVNTAGITIVGWGAKGNSGIIKDPWSNKLSFSVLHFYPLKDCQDIYSKEYVSQNNFCAGFISRGGGACNRDVGGPGISDKRLLGIISFGPTVCGSPDSPTVFTKVAYYAEWIEGIMEQKVPVANQRTTLQSNFNPYNTANDYAIKRTTTFLIPPISGKLKPKSIFDIAEDNIKVLRNVKKELFQEFLLPLFNSKELEQYKDLFKIVDKSPKESINSFNTQNVTRGLIASDEYGEGFTNDIETDEVTESSAVKFTVLDDTSPDSSEDIISSKTPDVVNEKQRKDTEGISKLLNEINLEEIIQEELDNQYSTETQTDNESPKDSDELVYLTNFENNQETEENDDKGFKDLTRGGKLGITEDEIFKVLYDVINEEIKNKKV